MVPIQSAQFKKGKYRGLKIQLYPCRPRLQWRIHKLTSGHGLQLILEGRRRQHWTLQWHCTWECIWQSTLSSPSKCCAAKHWKVHWFHGHYLLYWWVISLLVDLWQWLAFSCKTHSPDLVLMPSGHMLFWYLPDARLEGSSQTGWMLAVILVQSVLNQLNSFYQSLSLWQAFNLMAHVSSQLY